jgi:hypothetical protein
VFEGMALKKALGCKKKEVVEAADYFWTKI